MNLITRTLRPQFLNKNIAFRAICTNGYNGNRLQSTPESHTACCNRYQHKTLLSATTGFHSNSVPQIDFIRSYSATTEGAFDRWLKRFFRLDKDSKSNAIRAGFLLYEEVVDQIDYPKFFQQFNMENSFYSWFLVTEIHVWMLMVRAMAEKTVFKQLRNSIVEAMWRDVELRTKKLGHSKRSVLRKQINDLADQFEYTLIAYDEGILSDDKQMASAIWAQFFDQKCDDFTQIELMLKYVRENTAMLDKMTSEQILLKRKVRWIDLSVSTTS